MNYIGMSDIYKLSVYTIDDKNLLETISNEKIKKFKNEKYKNNLEKNCKKFYLNNSIKDFDSYKALAAYAYSNNSLVKITDIIVRKDIFGDYYDVFTNESFPVLEVYKNLNTIEKEDFFYDKGLNNELGYFAVNNYEIINNMIDNDNKIDNFNNYTDIKIKKLKND